MTDAKPRSTPAIITTSWDDGHPLDRRLAELLSSHGLVGTFYVPLSCYKRPVMTGEQLHMLRSLGMEIGSHTMTHQVLTTLTPHQAGIELQHSKAALEQTMGEAVTALCYPKGKYNGWVRALAAQAGYTVARTTLAFHTEPDFDPLRMPVSLQVFPHRSAVHLKHALKEGNVKGLVQWCTRWQREPDPLTLVTLIVEHIQQYGGICHIWGHTWEIAQYGLWKLLEAMVRRLASRPGVQYLTNTQVVQHLGHSAS